ncbi:hypothetical protein [Nocardiopsis dassonvillei]|uniref:hypothetical protein n=1 Tax=Nocardiopsis dassonvillei TaxID=2014 RepID=UPI001EE3303A|nr:hypothetical protein [Nocardiopsis dassonvillei]
MKAQPTWRTRFMAVTSFVDHLLCHTDSLISAWLDVRPLRYVLADFSGCLGRTWREHLHHAHVRRYGPGRGLLAVVITRPKTTDDKETP